MWSRRYAVWLLCILCVFATACAPDVTHRSPVPVGMTESVSEAWGLLGERKLKGGNVVPKPSVGPPGLWAEWDWENWIKPQLDRAVSLGLNAIRIIGAPQVVLADTSPGLPAITSARYVARWEQIAQYCLDHGLALYPGLNEKWAYMYTQFGGRGGMPPWDFQDPEVTAVIVASAEALSRYPNVIGFDIFQEGGGSHGDGLLIEDVLALYGAIRAAAPDVPLTTSDSSGSYATSAEFWNNTTSLPYQLWTHDDGADFVDIHVYLEGVVGSEINGLLKRTGRPVLIGEYGASQADNRDTRIARYRSAQTLHNRTDIAGSFLWALADQGDRDDRRFGIYDNSGFSQPDYPTSRGQSPLSVTSGRRPEMIEILDGFRLNR